MSLSRSNEIIKIRVLSDLHIEFGDWTPPDADADIVVLAGDIHASTAGLDWARKHFRDSPIIYVAGNHEFYRGHMEQALDGMRRSARELDIHFLDNEAAVVGEVRFLGATLWTDFNLYGSTPTVQARAKRIAELGMNDFHIIGYKGRRLHPDDSQAINQQTVKWLENRLSEPFEGHTVVVTHHLPHERCIDKKYAGSDLNPAFASHLPDLVRSPVDLWIHGHTHEPVDFITEGTRVVCNPRGYAGYELNPAFDPCKVVALGPQKATLQRRDL